MLTFYKLTAKMIIPAVILNFFGLLRHRTRQVKTFELCIFVKLKILL